MDYNQILEAVKPAMQKMGDAKAKGVYDGLRRLVIDVVMGGKT